MTSVWASGSQVIDKTDAYRTSLSWGAAVEERFQLSGPRRVTKLSQSFRFNLPNTFTRYRKVLTNFLERMLRSCRTQTETHLDHFFFARRECRQDFIRNFTQVGSNNGIGRVQDRLVFDKVTEMWMLFFTNQRLQRNRLLGDLQKL